MKSISLHNIVDFKFFDVTKSDIISKKLSISCSVYKTFPSGAVSFVLLELPNDNLLIADFFFFM